MSDIFLSRRILKKKLAYVFNTWKVMPPIRKDINEVIEKSVVGEVVRVGREPSGFTDMRGKTICNGDIVMCHNNPKDICKGVRRRVQPDGQYRVQRRRDNIYSAELVLQLR